MSQRTRSHTSAAASRSPRAASTRPGATPPPPATPKVPSATAVVTAAVPGTDPLDPAQIARTLRAVADELERDPALARRVAASAGQGAAGGAAGAEASAPPAGDGAGAGGEPRRAGTAGAFRPRVVTGVAADLVGPGIPDPFALRAQRGEAGLRAALEGLRLGTLRAIVRTHQLDPSGRASRQNDAARLRALILEASGTVRP